VPAGPQLMAGHLAVGPPRMPLVPPDRPLACGADPVGDDGGRLTAHAGTEEFRAADRLHRDPQVDTVHQRPGQPRPIPLDGRGPALTDVVPHPVPAARTRVRRQNHQKPGRHPEHPRRPRDHHVTGLQRLAQAVQDAAVELSGLVNVLTTYPLGTAQSTARHPW